MSVNYAAGLSAYDNKGKLGLPELLESPSELKRKVNILTRWMKASNYVIAHTGAGVSTAAGIPDFRGPNGVWTLEAEGKQPHVNVTFDEAVPTFTHLALVTLEKNNILKYLVTQNVDGLHLRSGFPRDRMSELHGNMFVERCASCATEQVHMAAINSIGQKATGRFCEQVLKNDRSCRGKLRDTVLDWEASLPEDELSRAEKQSSISDLSICLGSTLQIVPAGTLPLLTKKNGGRVVIINLQQTKQDKHANLVIHARVDDVMRQLMLNLGLAVDAYYMPAFSRYSIHGPPAAPDAAKRSSDSRRTPIVRRRRRTLSSGTASGRDSATSSSGSGVQNGGAKGTSGDKRSVSRKRRRMLIRKNGRAYEEKKKKPVAKNTNRSPRPKTRPFVSSDRKSSFVVNQNSGQVTFSFMSDSSATVASSRGGNHEQQCGDDDDDLPLSFFASKVQNGKAGNPVANGYHVGGEIEIKDHCFLLPS